MIAPTDSTAETMKHALATSLGALDAAVELDIDRTPEDRAFFAAEKAKLQPVLDAALAADNALELHLLLTTAKQQARIEVGDAVLDRGVRTGKRRMGLALQMASPGAADEVFGADISEIVDAERRIEPGLVIKAVGDFQNVPDFAGKAELASDLNGRAHRQAKNFTDRDDAGVIEASLDGILGKAVANGSGALYGLEKRLLDRFQRQKVYVRAFFLDVAPARKKATIPNPAPPG